MAVTKGFSAAVVSAVLEAGVVDIGENYAGELLSKHEALSCGRRTGRTEPVACWHYLGTIQRRKVKELAPVVDCWHAVSRLTEAEAIVRHEGAKCVMVEVETTGLPGRNGCPPSETRELVHAMRQMGLEVRGLMVMGPAGPPELSREAFRTAARLAAALDLQELSMGMSDDLEVAVEEGATIVRVGCALFGERPRPAR